MSVRRRAARLASYACAAAGDLRAVAARTDPSETAELTRERFGTTHGSVRSLLADLVAFWYPDCVDPSGGYRYNRSHAGADLGAHLRAPLTEARFVHFLSRLSTSELGHAGHLAAARHGVGFLRDTMRDDTGGFPTVTGANGSVVEAGHDLATHSFVVAAVSAYARASGDPDAARFAREVADVIETRFHDGVHGGYHEACGPRWEPAPPPSPQMVGRAGIKTLDVQVHQAEALVELARLDPTAVQRDRLEEVRHVLVDLTVLGRRGVGAAAQRDDWGVATGHPWRRRVRYGVDVQRVTVLADLDDLLGVDPDQSAATGERLLAAALRWGLDRRNGGVFDSGPPGGPAWERRKVWWVQAEALLASARVFDRCGSPGALRAFLAVLDWIAAHQVDPVHGEWFAVVPVDAASPAPKAGRWKTPYHNGRALVACLEMTSPAGQPVSR